MAAGNKLARRSLTGAVVGSIAIHTVLALIGGVWIVSKYYQNDPPKFVAAPVPKVKVPPQTRQHRMNLAAHAGLAAKPTFKARLVSLRPTAFALPEAPKISVENMLTPDPAAITSTMVTSLGGIGGAGAGAGFGLGGAGGKGLGTGLNFMGIQADGRRVILLFDVSRSVVNKANGSSMPLAKIKEETIALIEKLPADARFGIIQFVRNYKPFQPELIPATRPNRDLAKQWIEKEWKESGMMPKSGKGVISPEPNGLPPILRAAYEMKPDVIFLISDGSFERTSGGKSEKVPDEELENLFKEVATARVPLHFIGFQMKDDDKTFWSKATRRQGGSLREIK
ncbi:MAG: hypothetical protein V4733_01070 [Verrucomicrobiota bacterium]